MGENKDFELIGGRERLKRLERLNRLKRLERLERLERNHVG